MIPTVAGKNYIKPACLLFKSTIPLTCYNSTAYFDIIHITILLLNTTQLHTRTHSPRYLHQVSLPRIDLNILFPYSNIIYQATKLLVSSISLQIHHHHHRRYQHYTSQCPSNLCTQTNVKRVFTLHQYSLSTSVSRFTDTLIQTSCYTSSCIYFNINDNTNHFNYSSCSFTISLIVWKE